MATSLSATTVNKLNGENWSTWKFETRIILNGQGLYEIVSGEKLKPETPSEMISWVRDDAKAQTIIVTRMEPGPQGHILSCETAHEMWTKLKSVYDKESTVSIHLLQQRFFTMQFDEGSVSDFLSKLGEIRVKLKQAGEAITDKMTITKVLMSLPEQYKYFRSAWESAPSEKQTLDELTSRLLLEEERNKNSTEQDVAIALVTHGSSKCLTCGKAGHVKKDCYKNKTCEFCKKPGHIAKYCFFRKNNKTNKNQVSPIALVASQLDQIEDCFYMDSGCSQHMTRSRHIFCHYEELQDHPVHMGDGATINAIGIGNVRLEAFNGQKWQEVELKQVLYVPDLKKYHEYNVEVARKDGLLLVRELAAEVKNHMDFKINAVMRIMDSAEAAALSSGGADGPGAYYDARWLNVHADDGTLAARARRLVLAPSRHFDHIAVNASYSAVLMPPYINVDNADVQNQIAWSEHLDPLFVNNYEIDPSLSWQYYASSTGFMRRYPAMSWPPEDGYSHHARDFYDFRSSNWFVEAATSPKDLVILLDDSDDLGSSYWRLAKATVSGLLDTLGPNDFVNVYRYSDTVSEIHSCYTKILAQAVPETVRELKTALWGAEATGGAANLTGALTTGFEILHRYNRTGLGCQCNQAIAVVGAGGGAAGVKGVFRTWNWPHMPVRIFSYGVGGDAASSHSMKDMACTNKGFYVTINEHSEIRAKVLHMVEVLARPLVMYQTMHPVHWSPVYVGGRSSNLDDDGMGQLMTSVTVPIFDRRNHTHREANLLGVVGTDVPVDQIKKLVPPYKLGVNGYSFMVDNNGHVLYHPDLRPLYTNEEYTETLRPLYSSVDLTDVELLVDADENSRVNLTSLLLDLRHDMIEQREGETEIGVKVQYGSMRRVATRRQRYFYSPVEGTPYSLAIVLPDGYGMYELQAEQEVKHSPINVTEYFKGDWKIHPDWVYCEYASTSDQTFNSAEEQLLHFLARAGRPGWKWMSLRPRALTLHNAHKKQDRDSYYCDKNLVQSLVRDAMVIKELDAHIGHANHHNQQGRFHKFVVAMSFIATRSGLFKWTDNNNSSRTGDSAEPHFSERHARAFDSEWYRRAVEHHAIEPESFVFSVPFREGAEAAPPLVLATHAVFVESRGHRAPAAVVGLHFHLDSLAKHFLNVTSTCTAGTVCKKTCAGDALDCYILDDNGFIILSEDAAQTGLFFGQVDGTIMDSLVQDRIYKKVTVHDRQGRCPDSRNPFSGEGNKLTPFKPLSWLGGYLTSLIAVWFPLWQSIKAHAHPYADDDIDYEDYEHEDGDVDEEERERGKYEIIIDGFGAAPAPERPVGAGPGAGAPREPPREAARSAAVRPCDTSAELYTLQSTRLNAAQPLKGKLTNCHNSGCERPFSVQKIPHSNLILLVVDTLCPCGAKRLDVRAREAPPRAVCRRHPAHAARRRPRHCVSYHPEEIEILSCGRGYSSRAQWALVVLAAAARWLARAT